MSEELAWCGGFYDGEGSTYVNMPTVTKYGLSRGRNTTQIVIKIGQENSEVLYKFLDNIKTGHIRNHNFSGIPHKRKINKSGSKYTWSVESKFDVGDVVKKLWPFLTIIKRQQIIKSIDNYLTTPHFGVGAPGQPRNG